MVIGLEEACVQLYYLKITSTPIYLWLVEMRNMVLERALVFAVLKWKMGVQMLFLQKKIKMSDNHPTVSANEESIPVYNIDLESSIVVNTNESESSPSSESKLNEQTTITNMNTNTEPTILPIIEEKPIHFPRKKITIGNRQFSIILQSINGPCPLVAITNVLLLRGNQLPGLNPNTTTPVTDFELVQILANFCLNFRSQLVCVYNGLIKFCLTFWYRN